MKHRVLSFCAVAVLAGSMAWGQEAKTPPKFAEVVASRFDDWDKNHDGTISDTEIDSACVSASIKGTDAAAVATLKRLVRSGKVEFPPLTKEFLTHAYVRSGPAKPVVEEDRDRADSPENNPTPPTLPTPTTRRATTTTPVKATLGSINFDQTFRNCVTKIEKTDRALFVGDQTADIEHCHQGPLGDCFFVSVVGAVVKRDPSAVRKMIHENSESDGGGYTVEFGGGREVKVSALTDAEVAISSTTRDRGGEDGLWLAVLEKAFGASRQEDAPGRYTMESLTDAIARGGTTSTSIRVLTGHTTERIMLKRRARATVPEQYDVNKRLIPAPSTPTATLRMEPAQDPVKLAAAVREKVGKALGNGRIVAVGTGEEKQPPGISGKHAYAVLAFDPEKDVLTVWNPHGNNYTPRGEAGLSGGYPTKGGIFELPVKDFVRIFTGVTIETDKVSGAKKA